MTGKNHNLKKDTATILTVLVLQLVQKKGEHAHLLVNYISFPSKKTPRIMLQMKAAKTFSQQIFLIILTIIWQDPSSLGISGLSLDKYFLDPRKGFRFKTKGWGAGTTNTKCVLAFILMCNSVATRLEHSSFTSLRCK